MSLFGVLALLIYGLSYIVAFSLCKSPIVVKLSNHHGNDSSGDL